MKAFINFFECMLPEKFCVAKKNHPTDHSAVLTQVLVIHHHLLPPEQREPRTTGWWGALILP